MERITWGALLSALSVSPTAIQLPQRGSLYKKDRPQAVFPYYNYIFSGAVQPMRVMALCSTARVVSASFKRA